MLMQTNATRIPTTKAIHAVPIKPIVCDEYLMSGALVNNPMCSANKKTYILYIAHAALSDMIKR